MVDESLSLPRRMRIAREFVDLCSCCAPRQFEGKLRERFPTVDDMIGEAGEECTQFIKGWASSHVVITKVVEYAHWVVNLQVRKKGPARPTDFRLVSDGYVLNRFAVLHSETMSVSVATAKPDLDFGITHL